MLQSTAKVAERIEKRLLEVGDSITSSWVQITEAESDDFVVRYGDHNRLHKDDKVARQLGFMKRLVPAALTLSKALGLAWELGLTDCAIFREIGLSFPNPLYPSEFIAVRATLLEQKTFRRASRQKVTLRVDVAKNSWDIKDIVQSGTWTGTLPYDPI